MIFQLEQEMNSEFYTSHQRDIGKYVLYQNQLLGKGVTGSVYKGINKSNGTFVAIKHIDMKTINDAPTRSLLQNQKKALQMVDSPNSVKLYDIVQQPGHTFIVTQILEGGTLRQYLDKKKILDQVEALKMFRGIINGAATIIQSCVIHRDLKPANILLSSNEIPKIIDFGFCQIIMGGVVRAYNVGSPAYMAPQALNRTLYSQKSDAWSLGIILFEMLHGNTPDGGKNIKQFFQIIKNDPQTINRLIRPGLDKNVRQILQKSLKFTPEERLSVSGMKYLCDVVNIKFSKQSLNQPNYQPKHFIQQKKPEQNFIRETYNNYNQEKVQATLNNNFFSTKSDDGGFGLRDAKITSSNQIPFQFREQDQKKVLHFRQNHPVSPMNRPVNYDRNSATSSQFLFPTRQQRVIVHQVIQEPVKNKTNTMGFISFQEYSGMQNNKNNTNQNSIFHNQNSRLSQANTSNSSIKQTRSNNQNSQFFHSFKRIQIPSSSNQMTSLSSKMILDQRQTGPPILRQVAVKHLRINRQ